MLLSFILPTYNVEKYLPCCIQSLETQNLEKNEYELIFVNDASTDNSLAVIRKFQEQYSNIRLVDLPENGGVSRARNEGLKAATGTWIWFIDPDDFILCDCLKQISELLLRNQKTDFVCFTAYHSVAQDAVPVCAGQDWDLEQTNALAEVPSVCSYILRREFLVEKQLCFDESLFYGEDYLFTFQINVFAELKLFLKTKVYFYRIVQTSAMHSKDLQKRLRHMDDLRKLTFIYQGLLQDDRYNPARKQQLTIKIKKTTRSYLFDLIRYTDKDCFMNGLQHLKHAGLYPYKNDGLPVYIKHYPKVTLANIICLFFVDERMLKLCYKALHRS